MSSQAPDAKLEALEQRWVQLTAIPEPPQSLLQVLNYSLGSKGQGEVFMTRVLRYFLDPTEPHGMDDEFLRAFLEGLRSHQQSTTNGDAFAEDTYDLSDVLVSRQVRLGLAEEGDSDEVETTGPVDFVVEAPGEWYLLVELKFGSTENNLTGKGLSQTEGYQEAKLIRDRPKADFESGGYYLYLHRQGKADARDPAFTNWTWSRFADDVLADFILDNAARYPTRTVVQLRELHDDIRELSGMTDSQQNTEEMIELYLEHYDAISDVTEAFDERWGTFSDEWADRFATQLAEAGYGEKITLEDQLVGIDLNRDGDTDQWVFRAHRSDWATLMKDGWWLHTNTYDTLHGRANDGKDARVGFYHRLETNRDLALGKKTFKFLFRNNGSNDDEFIKEFNEQLKSRRDALNSTIPQSAEIESITDTRRDLISATYDIRVDDHEDFFTAYLAALEEAFDDFVVENPEFVELIDEVYDQAFEIYE